MSSPVSPSPALAVPPEVSSAVLAAWQGALAAEHAAVYGYGTLGPRLAGAARALARTLESEHRSLRDSTETAIAALGAVPVGALASYPPTLPIAAAAAELGALGLENTCAQAWRYLLATAAGGGTTASDRAARSAGQTNLTASAVRAMRWRLRTDPSHPTDAFPGI